MSLLVILLLYDKRARLVKMRAGSSALYANETDGEKLNTKKTTFERIIMTNRRWGGKGGETEIAGRRGNTY